MDTVCPECGEESLEVDFEENETIFVCSSCGTTVNSNSGRDEENESTIDEDYDYEDDEEEKAVMESPTKHGNNPQTVEIPPSDLEINGSKTMALTDNVQIIETDNTNSNTNNANGTGSTEIIVPNCKGCGSSDFSYETINDSDQLVCTNCGYFIETQELTSAVVYTNISGTLDRYQWSKGPCPKNVGGLRPVIARGKDAGLSKIMAVSMSLSLRPELVDQAKALFNSLYTNENVICLSVGLKETLGACCVLFVARQNRLDITLKTLTAIHNARKKLYTKALRLLKMALGPNLKPPDILTLPSHVLGGTGFTPQLIDKVSKVIELCQEGFVSQGRDCTNLIIVVAHAAWISENQSQFRTVKLKKFCSMFRLPYSQHSEILRKHVHVLLAKLANQLPWLKGTVKNYKAIMYVGDIVKYRQTLLKGALQKEKSVSLGNNSFETIKSHAIVPPCLYRKKKVGQASDVNGDQYKLPAHLTGFDLDNPELGHSHDVIPDSEIEDYLVPDNEIPLRKEMLKF